jgi:hypothetical protein
MNPDPIEYDRWFPLVPPSYEQCAAAPAAIRADYVVSPLDMASLLAWDEEDDDY